MLNYDKIKDIITNKYGFKTLDDWKNHLINCDKNIEPTQEEVELLSPDNIDCGVFWKVCTDLFGIDPVCNIVEPGYSEYTGSMYDIMSGNRRNLGIIKSFGFLSYLEEFRDKSVGVMEFGAGFGSLKNWIEVNTSNRYVGFDVNPLTDGVYKLDWHGKILHDISHLKGKMSKVVCFNVFQHMSEKQRLYFFDTAVEYLYTGGVLMFNTTINPSDRWGYTKFYGQFVPVPKATWVDAELKKRKFDIQMVINRSDNETGYVAIKV